jgi:hypothetical protein
MGKDPSSVWPLRRDAAVTSTRERPDTGTCNEHSTGECGGWKSPQDGRCGPTLTVGGEVTRERLGVDLRSRSNRTRKTGRHHSEKPSGAAMNCC